MHVYGKSGSDASAEQKLLAREAARQLGDLGFTDEQKIVVINCLALELENIGLMKAITKAIREHGEGVFLSEPSDPDEEVGPDAG